jgi:hypothetical protein
VVRRDVVEVDEESVGVGAAAACEEEIAETEAASVAFVRLKPSG